MADMTLTDILETVRKRTRNSLLWLCAETCVNAVILGLLIRYDVSVSILILVSTCLIVADLGYTMVLLDSNRSGSALALGVALDRMEMRLKAIPAQPSEN